MKRILCPLAFLTIIIAASCNSENKKASSVDSLFNDTSVIDSPSADSVDVVDSLGLGTTPGTKP